MVSQLVVATEGLGWVPKGLKPVEVMRWNLAEVTLRSHTAYFKEGGSVPCPWPVATLGCSWGQRS